MKEDSLHRDGNTATSIETILRSINSASSKR
jgi:predicted RNA-binding protein YlqC (UPF0109 family)